MFVHLPIYPIAFRRNIFYICYNTQILDKFRSKPNLPTKQEKGYLGALVFLGVSLATTIV
jgi:hypothetical protein